MPLFPQAVIAAARQREQARNEKLRTTTAAEIRDWIATQDGIDHANISPRDPGAVYVELTDGTDFTITVTPGD